MYARIVHNRYNCLAPHTLPSTLYNSIGFTPIYIPPTLPRRDPSIPPHLFFHNHHHLFFLNHHHLLLNHTPATTPSLATMTEYDYSPEAYERYMAKQHSIANWVSKTNSYPPANPFVPTTPAVQAKSLQRDMTRSSGHSSHHSRSKSAKYDDRRDRDRDVKPRDRDWDRQHYSDRPSNSSPTAPYLPPSNSHSRPSHSRRSSNQTTRTPPSSRHHASASVSHLPPSNRDRPAASRSQTQIAIPPTGRQKLPTRSNTSPTVAYPAHGNQRKSHSPLNFFRTTSPMVIAAIMYARCTDQWL